MVAAELLIFDYNGSSMNPTFKAGDQLWIEPYVTRKVAVGDVIVFRPEGEEHFVTHRVIGVDDQVLVTKGDNNFRVDSYRIRSGDITGCVVSVRRKENTLKVRNGLEGICYAHVRWTIKSFNHSVSRVLHPLYRTLAESGVFRISFLQLPKPTIIRFIKPDGVELQLFFGRYFIGRRRPGAKEWQIKRPFRLFIDTTLLKE